VKDFGPLNDPTSFLGYQIAHRARRPGGKPPRNGGCGLGCLPLAIGALVGLMIALLAR